MILIMVSSERFGTNFKLDLVFTAGEHSVIIFMYVVKESAEKISKVIWLDNLKHNENLG